jgi:hypothetical protein
MRRPSSRSARRMSLRRALFSRASERERRSSRASDSSRACGARRPGSSANWTRDRLVWRPPPAEKSAREAAARTRRAAGEQLDAGGGAEADDAADGAAAEGGGGGGELEAGVGGAAVDGDAEGEVGVVAGGEEAGVLPGGLEDAALELVVGGGSLEQELGAGLHGGGAAGRGLEVAGELELPGAVLGDMSRGACPGRQTRTRADDDALRLEAEDRPEADAEAADLVAALLLAGGVEGEQVAAGVLVAHALAVVAAAQAPQAVDGLAGEGDGAGAGVAGVLQQLAHEDPRVRSVAVGLGAGAGPEVAGGRVSHGAGLSRVGARGASVTPRRGRDRGFRAFLVRSGSRARRRRARRGSARWRPRSAGRGPPARPRRGRWRRGGPGG